LAGIRPINIDMHRGEFADQIVTGLQQNVSLFDNVAGMAWNAAGKALLLRIQPVNQQAWRETGELVVDELRRIAETVRFKARCQILQVAGARNLIFSLEPKENVQAQ
jgi:hypothetical protein